jgi:DNA-binding LytR/AlgR family response regulator
VVGACTAMTLLDTAVFPLVIRGSMPGAEVIFERYPVRVSRSVILRLDRIEGIRWNWQQGTQLSFIGSDATLTIGRSAARRLKDRLGLKDRLEG